MIIDASALLLLVVRAQDLPVDEVRLGALLERIAKAEPVEGPALLAFELGNVIHRKRANEIGDTVSERVKTLQRLLAMVELRTPGASVLEDAGRTAEKSRMSFYDASYLAEARRVGQPLLTADSGLKAHAVTQGIDAYLLPQDLARLEAAYPTTAP